jgi:hypothetical protein
VSSIWSLALPEQRQNPVTLALDFLPRAMRALLRERTTKGLARFGDRQGDFVVGSKPTHETLVFKTSDKPRIRVI